MVVTILEAVVPNGKWAKLKNKFNEMITSAPLPNEISQTFLIQDMTENIKWRLISIWKSHELFLKYKSSVEIPGGVLLFKSVGSEPKFTLSEVIGAVESKG